MENIKLGSLFDGIGGFPLAATLHGITPVWASEIEKFPIEVTKIRFPNMKHLGDITQINGAEIEPVDIISAGSPCQDLSVAGKREGLKGERSGLFMEFIRIVREMRNATANEYPRFVIWENVPGAFSSNGGQDFRSVLEEIMETEIPMPQSGKWVKSKKGKPIPPNAPTEIRDGTTWYWRIHWAKAGMVRGNGCSLAWRVLDAQYWGVPQRRKRIFLVADFAGQSAPEILFECEGVPGDIAESREKGQETSTGVRDGVTTAGGKRVTATITASYSTNWNGNSGADTGDHFVLAESRETGEEVAGDAGDGADGSITFREVAGTLRANAGAPKHEADWEQLVCQAAPFNTGQITSPQNGNKVEFGLPCHTLSANEHPPSAIISYSLQGSMIGRADKNGPHGGNLACNQGGMAAVEKSFTPSQFGQYQEGIGTLRANGGDLGGGSENLVQKNCTVRRLTPLECERLQGFPDNWTNIPGASDTGRYKGLGNSVAVPCVAWLIGRIKEATQ